MTRPIDDDELAARLLELEPGRLCQVVDKAGRIREHRAIQPELRADVLRAVDRSVEAGRIGAAGADLIRAELDHATPAAVLEAHSAELIPDRPLGGAFPRQRPGVEPVDLDVWLRADPQRLGGLVREARRFSADLTAIATAILELADALGIDEATADAVVGSALKDDRQGKRHVG